MTRLCVGVVAAACAVAGLQTPVDSQGRARPAMFPTKEQFAASSEAQRRVAAARALAKNDLVKEFETVCSSTGPQRAAVAREAAGLPPLPNTPVEPTKIFDNMWFLGPNAQGAFVITTSAGLILLDTLNDTAEARDILVPSMRKAGLDPEQIKYVVVSHGHAGQTDHTGGASYIQSTYKPRVLMGKPDWDAIIPAQRPDNPMPKRDIEVTGDYKLTLGDTTLTLAPLPGHSPGTLAIFVPVKDKGRPTTAMVFASLQVPSRESARALERVINTHGRPMKAETILNSHPGIFQDTLAWMDTIRKNPQGPNPALYGVERFDRYMSIMVECGHARAAALEPQS